MVPQSGCMLRDWFSNLPFLILYCHLGSKKEDVTLMDPVYVHVDLSDGLCCAFQAIHAMQSLENIAIAESAGRGKHGNDRGSLDNTLCKKHNFIANVWKTVLAHFMGNLNACCPDPFLNACDYQQIGTRRLGETGHRYTVVWWILKVEREATHWSSGPCTCRRRCLPPRGLDLTPELRHEINMDPNKRGQVEDSKKHVLKQV